MRLSSPDWTIRLRSFVDALFKASGLPNSSWSARGIVAWKEGSSTWAEPTAAVLAPASGTKRRGTLDEYFRTSSKKVDAKSQNIIRADEAFSATAKWTSSLLPGPRRTSVPGLTIHPSFISTAEEHALLSFLSTQSWRTDLSRRTIHYGGTYCLLPPRNATPDERKRVESTVIPATPMPKELNWLVDRMVARGLYDRLDRKRPEYCIVNEYVGNNGISAHVENFRFDEPVCALTLGNGDWMRFHELAEEHDGSVRSGGAREAPRTGKREDVWLPGRGLVLMGGQSRWRWQHEIVRGRKGRKGKKGRSGSGWKRVSLTFRVEKAKTRELAKATR